MLPDLFLQLTLLAGVGLAQSAGNLGAKVIDGAQILVDAKSPFENWDVVEGALLADCNDSISVCGKTGKMKIVSKHKETIYNTISHTKEDVITLDTETVMVTKTEYETTTTSTEGQCRETTVIVDPIPLIVDVQVTVTTTREFVPVVTAYTTTKQPVYVKAIEQCLVKPNLPVPGPSPPAKGPPVQSGDPVIQAPIVSPSSAAKNDSPVDPIVSATPKEDTDSGNLKVETSDDDIPDPGNSWVD